MAPLAVFSCRYILFVSDVGGGLWDHSRQYLRPVVFPHPPLGRVLSCFDFAIEVFNRGLKSSDQASEKWFLIAHHTNNVCVRRDPDSG